MSERKEAPDGTALIQYHYISLQSDLKQKTRTISPNFGTENNRDLYNFASTGILPGLFRKP